MTDQNPQERPTIDKETLESLQQALYPRLRDHLVSEVGDRLLREAAEQPVPMYYDRFIGSEIQRLEEAIERNGQRIGDLREEMDRRFSEAKEEREQLRVEMSRRLGEAKEDRDHRFGEAKAERGQLRSEMNRRFSEAKAEREQLRFEMNRRFGGAKEEREQLRSEMNQRFEQMERRFDQLTVSMRNWALAAVALITVVVTILNLLLG